MCIWFIWLMKRSTFESESLQSQNSRMFQVWSATEPLQIQLVELFMSWICASGSRVQYRGKCSTFEPGLTYLATYTSTYPPSYQVFIYLFIWLITFFLTDVRTHGRTDNFLIRFSLADHVKFGPWCASPLSWGRTSLFIPTLLFSCVRWVACLCYKTRNRPIQELGKYIDGNTLTNQM